MFGAVYVNALQKATHDLMRSVFTSWRCVVTDDIVTRLRAIAPIHEGRKRHECISEAADEIERLRSKYDRLLNHIQLVAQSPDSRFARDILRYYYPLSQNGVGTSITLKWVDDEAVCGES